MSRPEKLGFKHYGTSVIIVCPGSGKPLPEGAVPARRAGSSTDSHRSINPKSNAYVPLAKKDGYTCVHEGCSRSYVQLNKQGLIAKHRIAVSKVDYEAGRYDTED